jgi:AraC-like DNA-binding protein
MACQEAMLYRCRVPRPPLDRFIQWIWLCRNSPQPHALERILPFGVSQLIVNLNEDQTRLYDPDHGHLSETLPGSVIAGVRSRYAIIDTSEQEYVAGVVFKPGGLVPFVRVPALETTDAHVPLDLLWSRADAARLRERILESRCDDTALAAMEEVLREMWRPPGLHPAIRFALTAFERAPHTTSIAEVTNAIGLSAKSFIERFKMEVGVTPKRFCRILRFQRAVAHAHQGSEVDWTEVALDCGYFDQSHFIHDFRSFSGLTPTGYQAGRTPFQNHVKFLQSETSGI